MISVSLTGPDKVRSIVRISEKATVRDVVTSKYPMFRRATNRNGVMVDPFTTQVVEGDSVSVEEMRRGE
jgi:hypothetical protein